MLRFSLNPRATFFAATSHQKPGGRSADSEMRERNGRQASEGNAANNRGLGSEESGRLRSGRLGSRRRCLRSPRLRLTVLTGLALLIFFAPLGFLGGYVLARTLFTELCIAAASLLRGVKHHSAALRMLFDWPVRGSCVRP